MKIKKIATCTLATVAVALPMLPQQANANTTGTTSIPAVSSPGIYVDPANGWLRMSWQPVSVPKPAGFWYYLNTPKGRYAPGDLIPRGSTVNNTSTYVIKSHGLWGPQKAGTYGIGVRDPRAQYGAQSNFNAFDATWIPNPTMTGITLAPGGVASVTVDNIRRNNLSYPSNRVAEIDHVLVTFRPVLLGKPSNAPGDTRSCQATPLNGGYACTVKGLEPGMVYAVSAATHNKNAGYGQDVRPSAQPGSKVGFFGVADNVTALGETATVPSAKAKSGSSAVTVSWTAAADAPGGVFVGGYQVIDSKGNIKYSGIDPNLREVTFSAAPNVAEVYSVAPRMAWKNASGSTIYKTGDYLDTASVTPFEKPDMSGAVVEAVGAQGAAVVTWSGVKSTEPVTKVKIRDAATKNVLFEGDATNSKQIITGLGDSKTYAFEVSVFNGDWSDWAKSNDVRTDPNPKWLEEPTITKPGFNPATGKVEFEVTSNPVTLGVDVTYRATASNGSVGVVDCPVLSSAICPVVFPAMTIDGEPVTFEVTPIVDGKEGTPHVEVMAAPVAAEAITDVAYTAIYDCPNGGQLIGTVCRFYTGKEGYTVTKYRTRLEQIGRVPNSPDTACPAGWGPSYADWYGWVCNREVQEPYQETEYRCPSGWFDDGGNCARDESARLLANYRMEVKGGFNAENARDFGIARMFVNGVETKNGVSQDLGTCPGSVTVEYWGLGGKSKGTWNLCQ